MTRRSRTSTAVSIVLLTVAAACGPNKSGETFDEAGNVVTVSAPATEPPATEPPPTEPPATEPPATDPPVTDAPEPVCAPTPTEGVQDMLVADAEAYANTLAASAAANFEPLTGGLGCALPASGISGANGPDAAATAGAISAFGSPVSTKAGETIQGIAVLDTAGFCGLRVVVVQGGVPTPYTVTSQPQICSAYEAVDGFEAGEFIPLGG